MHIDFKEFEENFINEEHFGWVPVDSGYESGVANIELVVNWRLGDGKYKQFDIPIESQEQLDKIKGWLVRAGEWWNNEMVRHSKRFDTLEEQTEENEG